MGRKCAVVLCLAVGVHQSTAVSLRANLNPIRKVVTMLQTMQKKVEAEGEKEKELYEKFQCYCKSGNGDLSKSISDAEEKSPAVSSDIDETGARLTQSKEDLKKAQDDRVGAKRAMADATGIREKEAAAFAKVKADADANIAAVNKAVAALEKGMGSSFLQSNTAATVRQIVSRSEDLADIDRQDVIAFLAGETGSAYAPQSGDITGILKQMSDTMTKNLNEDTKSESDSIAAYEGLMAAKTKEVGALTSSVEVKTKQIGELGVQLVQLKEDLSDTQAALLADKAFLADLQKGCSSKEADWNERSKTRSEELVALADTIRVLNDDDALMMFRKTLPNPEKASLLQVSTSALKTRNDAMTLLSSAKKSADADHKAGLQFLMMALAGKRNTGGFDKVVKMVDQMVEVLGREQVDDDQKLEYCHSQLDLTDDKRKELERSISQKNDAVQTAKDGIETLTQDIAALEAGVASLDKSVAEATEQRKAENAEFKELMASDSAAKELLSWAKNRLNQFYNPKLHKTTPAPKLSREDQINVNMGGAPPPTEAPGGIAGTGISFIQTRRGAPAPPPETWDAYSKKSEESNGVIAMIDLLANDLEKEMTEASAGEKAGQKDYESMMGASANKRASDSALLTEKTSTKADVEAELEDHSEARTAATKEHSATMKYISSLHGECDWLVKYFDMRKDARAEEVDSLKKAKAVLSGAGYSFVQTNVHSFLAKN